MHCGEGQEAGFLSEIEDDEHIEIERNLNGNFEQNVASKHHGKGPGFDVDSDLNPGSKLDVNPDANPGSHFDVNPGSKLDVNPRSKSDSERMEPVLHGIRRLSFNPLLDEHKNDVDDWMDNDKKSKNDRFEHGMKPQFDVNQSRESLIERIEALHSEIHNLENDLFLRYIDQFGDRFPFWKYLKSNGIAPPRFQSNKRFGGILHRRRGIDKTAVALCFECISTFLDMNTPSNPLESTSLVRCRLVEVAVFACSCSEIKHFE